MALRKVLFTLIAAALSSGSVWAHVSPSGDTHPYIEVVDCKFAVIFGNGLGELLPGESPYLRIIYAPDGKILVPRHPLERKPQDHPYPYTGRSNQAFASISAVPSGELYRFVINRTDDKRTTREEPLALPLQKHAEVEAVTFAGPVIGFTWSGSETVVPGFPERQKQMLHLAHIAADHSREGSTVCLGEPACIYNFPSASSPVWAGGKWWVAWVRASESMADRKDPLKQWRTIFTSYDPAKRELKHTVVNELSTWNTKVDLKTTGGWLCAAWHAPVDGSYPGVAKICTAFIKASQP